MIQKFFKKSKLDLLFIFSVLLLISLTLIIFYNLRIGHEKIISQSIRFAISFILYVYTYKGSWLARYFTVLLFIIGGLTLIINVFEDKYPAQYQVLPLVVGVFILFLAFYIGYFREKILKLNW